MKSLWKVCLAASLSIWMLVISLYGQSSDVLTVGEKLPEDLLISNVLNGEGPILQLGQKAGKWLLLDFWGTYCPACIAEMPKMAQLQKRFTDKLVVLLVARESTERVTRFLERSPELAKLGLPIAATDSTLMTMFPHRIIPHVVWVDPDGVVRAITSGETVSEENVERVIGGADAGKLLQKKDNLDWNYTKPLGGQDDGQSALFRSVLKGYDASISSAQSVRRDSTSHERYYHHLYFANKHPVSMFYSAYMIFTGNFGTNINPHRIEVAIQDPLLKAQYANASLPQPFIPNEFPYLSWVNRDAFYRDNLFSYDLLLAKGVPDSVFLDYVFADLNKAFPIKGRVEYRKVPCLVVTAEDKAAVEQAIRSGGGKPRKVISSEHYGVINHPFRELIRGFTHFRSVPILDETGIGFPVDLKVDFTGSAALKSNMGLVVNMYPFDEAKFIVEMERYHLTVKRQEREVPILVIYD